MALFADGKLDHNFHELTALEKLVYLLFIRPRWDRERRFFFEGSFTLPGQMYIADRKALFETIRDEKPADCFEIGTYTGGGSTFFITQAFKAVGFGRLVTLESSDHLFNKASSHYARFFRGLSPFVTFVHGAGFDDLKPFMKDGKVGAFFLDGAENGQETLDQYLRFIPYCRKGTVLMAHDWNTEKTRLLRPAIERGDLWEKIVEVRPPASVGFVAFRHR
jgi:predicted O-methyltransferase YrrM